MLQFKITGQRMELNEEQSDKTLVSGSREFVKFSASFSEDWQDHFVVMRFEKEGGDAVEIADLKPDTGYPIPYEVLQTGGAFYVSCYGTKDEHELATTNRVRLDVLPLPSLPDFCESAQTPPQTVLAVLLERLAETARELSLAPLSFRAQEEEEGGYLQWKYETEADSAYRDLIALSAITGPRGEKGDKGDRGEITDGSVTASKLASGAVTTDKTSFWESIGAFTGSNLYQPVEWDDQASKTTLPSTEVGLLNYTDASRTQVTLVTNGVNSDYFTTGLIELPLVKSHCLICIYGSYTVKQGELAFYDENGDFIANSIVKGDMTRIAAGGDFLVSRSYLVGEVPSGAKYGRFSFIRSLTGNRDDDNVRVPGSAYTLFVGMVDSAAATPPTSGYEYLEPQTACKRIAGTENGIPLDVLNSTDIVDGLTSTQTDKALSANQGRVLKDLIDNFDPTIPDGAVTTEKLAPGAVTGAKLAPGIVKEKPLSVEIAESNGVVSFAASSALGDANTITIKGDTDTPNKTLNIFDKSTLKIGSGEAIRIGGDDDPAPLRINADTVGGNHTYSLLSITESGSEITRQRIGDVYQIHYDGLGEIRDAVLVAVNGKTGLFLMSYYGTAYDLVRLSKTGSVCQGTVDVSFPGGDFTLGLRSAENSGRPIRTDLWQYDPSQVVDHIATLNRVAPETAWDQTVSAVTVNLETGLVSVSFHAGAAVPSSMYCSPNLCYAAYAPQHANVTGVSHGNSSFTIESKATVEKGFVCSSDRSLAFYCDGEKVTSGQAQCAKLDVVEQYTVPSYKELYDYYALSGGGVSETLDDIAAQVGGCVVVYNVYTVLPSGVCTITTTYKVLERSYFRDCGVIQCGGLYLYENNNTVTYYLNDAHRVRHGKSASTYKYLDLTRPVTKAAIQAQVGAGDTDDWSALAIADNRHTNRTVIAAHRNGALVAGVTQGYFPDAAYNNDAARFASTDHIAWNIRNSTCKSYPVAICQQVLQAGDVVTCAAYRKYFTDEAPITNYALIPYGDSVYVFVDLHSTSNNRLYELSVPSELVGKAISPLPDNVTNLTFPAFVENAENVTGNKLYVKLVDTTSQTAGDYYGCGVLKIKA